MLILALTVISGLLALTAAGFARAVTDLLTAKRYAARMQAFYLAEGGVDIQIATISSGWLGSSQNLTSNELLLGITQTDVQDLGGGIQRITATGSVPDTITLLGQQVVEVTAQAGVSPFQWGVFGGHTITVGMQASVTGDVQTNNISKGAILLDTQSLVDGNVFVGAGPPPGDPAVVIDQRLFAVVTGQEAAAAENFSMPPITLPSGSPCGGPLVVGPTDADVLDLSDPALSCYSSIEVQSLGKLTIKGDGKLFLTSLSVGDQAQVIIQGRTTIVTTGNVTTTSQGQLALGQSGALRLFVTGQIALGDQGIANPTADPKNLGLFYAGTQDVTFGTQGGFTGAVYAPKASIKPGTQGLIKGSLVGLGVTLGMQAQVIFDESLKYWNGLQQDNAVLQLSWVQR